MADGGGAEWSGTALACGGGSWAQDCEVEATSRSDRGHCEALGGLFRDSSSSSSGVGNWGPGWDAGVLGCYSDLVVPRVATVASLAVWLLQTELR